MYQYYSLPNRQSTKFYHEFISSVALSARHAIARATPTPSTIFNPRPLCH